MQSRSQLAQKKTGPAQVSNDVGSRDSLLITEAKQRGYPAEIIEAMLAYAPKLPPTTETFDAQFMMIQSKRDIYKQLSVDGAIFADIDRIIEIRPTGNGTSLTLSTTDALERISKATKDSDVEIKPFGKAWKITSNAGFITLAGPLLTISDTTVAGTCLKSPYIKLLKCNVALVFAAARNRFSVDPTGIKIYSALKMNSGAGRQSVLTNDDLFTRVNECSELFESVLAKYGANSFVGTQAELQRKIVTLPGFAEKINEIYEDNQAIVYEILDVVQALYDVVCPRDSEYHFLNDFDPDQVFGTDHALTLGRIFMRLRADRKSFPDESKFTFENIPHALSVPLKQAHAKHALTDGQFICLGASGYMASFPHPALAKNGMRDLLPRSENVDYEDLKEDTTYDLPLVSDCQFKKADPIILTAVYGENRKSNAKGNTEDFHKWAGGFWNCESVRLYLERKTRMDYSCKMKATGPGDHHEQAYEHYLESFPDKDVTFSINGSRPHNSEFFLGVKKNENVEVTDEMKTFQAEAMKAAMAAIQVNAICGSLIRKAIEIGGPRVLDFVRGKRNPVNLAVYPSTLHDEEKAKHGGIYNPLQRPFLLTKGVFKYAPGFNAQFKDDGPFSMYTNGAVKHARAAVQKVPDMPDEELEVFNERKMKHMKQIMENEPAEDLENSEMPHEDNEGVDTATGNDADKDQKSTEPPPEMKMSVKFPVTTTKTRKPNRRRMAACQDDDGNGEDETKLDE